MIRSRFAGFLTLASRSKSLAVVMGTVSGILIILPAVAVSALVFRAYGWGLFVLTPFVVGFTTGYLVNRRQLLTVGQTNGLVLLSAALGCFALILFALEGLICLLLAAPLAALLAIGGGLWGRRLAKTDHDPAAPFYSIALLPAMFAVDAVSPPDASLLTQESIVIAAPAPHVWKALTSDDLIRERPTLAGRLGLAYPVRAHLSGYGVGSGRVGHFSTGIAHEKITEWKVNRALRFVVLSQPPAMKEMSPYAHVHAPHLVGYFETGETRFDLQPLKNGTTRLSVTAAHRLRLDPIFYWQPIARWAIQSNVGRVLHDIKSKAESA